jgi:putative SOS response-associated peptidase YedK
LWEQWRSPAESGAPPAAGAAPPAAGDIIATFTIVTTAAIAALRAVHDRMPVIVAAADYDEWLSSPNPSALLEPRQGEPLEIVPIGTRVNDVRNDDPGLLAPLPGV